MAQADTDAVVTLSNVRETSQPGGGVEALAEVSLSLHRGSYTAIGPSEPGKSRLLNPVAGLETSTEGRIDRTEELTA